MTLVKLQSVAWPRNLTGGADEYSGLAKPISSHTFVFFTNTSQFPGQSKGTMEPLALVKMF